MAKSKTINVKGTEITIIRKEPTEFISLTDMLKAKDGDFFISDWLRNRNKVELIGIWESIYNPAVRNIFWAEPPVTSASVPLVNTNISKQIWNRHERDARASQ